MINKYLYIAFFILSVFLFPGSLFSANKNDTGEQTEKTIIIRLKDQFDIVKFKSKLQGLTPEIKKQLVVAGMKEYCEQSQTRFVRSLETEKIIKLNNVRRFWLTNAVVCKVTDRTIEQLKKRSDIESICLDVPCKVFEDVHPKESDEADPVANSIEVVRALEANEYGFTGKGIVVAIIDSGVNYNHLDLKDNLWTNELYPNHGWDFCNNDNDPMDDNGHGTHCAGTILGNGKAGTRTGVAPDARLMILKTMSARGEGTQSDTWEAIEFAIENNANIISMSAGWVKANRPDEKSWRDIMVNLLNCDILCVIASGNEGVYITSGIPIPDNVRVPGNCPAAWLHPEQSDPSGISSVLTVGSTDETGSWISASSSRGPVTWQGIETYNDYPYNPGEGLIKPDIVAPGDQITSLNYLKTDGYIKMSGTSMSTPCVAGIVACMLSKNPALTPSEIVQTISESAIRMETKFNNNSGAGRVDALLATLNTPNAGVNCKSFTIEKTKGYANGLFNAGDEAIINLTFNSELSESLNNCELELKSLSPYIKIKRISDTRVTISANGLTDIKRNFAITVAQDAAIGDDVFLAVILRQEDKVITNLLRSFIAKTELGTDHFEIKEIEGNGNSRADKGEEIELAFPILNTGNESCKAVKASLTFDSPYLVFHNPEMETTDIKTTHKFIARFKVSNDTPDWRSIPLSLRLKGENIDTTFVYTLHIGKTGVLIVDRSKDAKSAKAFESGIIARKDISYLFVDQLPESLENYQTVWLFAGVYPKNRKITVADKSSLQKYLEKGGYVYAEGGDIWYDKQVKVKDLFHVNIIADDGGKLDSIVGCRKYYNTGDKFKYSYEQSAIDHIAPVTPGFALYMNNRPEFITTVAYDEGRERTIGSSFELGGVLNGTDFSIVNNYLEFFGFAEKSIQDKTSYFYCDFEKGIPDDFALYDLDKQPFHFTMTQYGFKEGNSWIKKSSGGNVFAASTSRYKEQEGVEIQPANDWMITPAIEIKAADAVLSWRAMAVCDNSKVGDGYKVLISTTGNTPKDFKDAPVFIINEELINKWTQHQVRLSAYAGKSIYIAFVNNTLNREVLAIDDIRIEGGKGLCEFDVETEEHVYDTDHVDIKCRVTAYSDIPVTDIVAYCKYGKDTFAKTISGLKMKKYDTYYFSFDKTIPVSLGDTVKYQVWVEVNNRRQPVIDKYAVSFAFKPRKKVVIEEGTGMWCGFCPRGTVAMEILKEKYPKDFIGIAVHSEEDMLKERSYADSISFYPAGFPSGIVNRKYKGVDPMTVITENGKKKYTTLNGGFETFFLKAKEEIALAQISLECNYQDGKINAETNVEFAVDFNKAHYQIAFAIKEDSVTGEKFYQQNYYAKGDVELDGYNNLPGKILNPVFHDVARAILSGFNGVPGSVPQSIRAKENYQFDYQFDVPGNINNLGRTEIIALLINKTTGEIVNADNFKMNLIVTGIQNARDDSYTVDCYPQNGNCVVSLSAPVATQATVSLYTVDGCKVSENELSVSGVTTISMPAHGRKGIHFITVSFLGNNRTVTRKVML